MPKLTNEELQVLNFWFLSCEDQSLEKSSNFYCQNCPKKLVCDKLRKKLGLKNEG